MTRKDTAVVGLLVVLLAVIAGVVGIPALQSTTASPEPSPTPGLAASRAYREGVVGHPVSISPLTAKTQADRDLVALLFSGLVRNGPDGTIVPDLAERWSVDADGRVWTFDLRPDARWHDGEPVTADDVVYTIQTLQDPAYSGPGATSWSEVDVHAVSPTEVTFTLATPLGGFLQAATQPIAPAHLLGEVPVSLLPDHPFGQQPVGSGPFELSTLDPDKAVLVPAFADDGAPGVADASAPPTDSLTSAQPTLRPERPTPYLSGIEMHFYDDVDALATAYRNGEVDGASDLPPSTAADLAKTSDSRLLRYPGSTLTAVLLNLRPDHPEFRDPAVRTALLAAIDRVGLIDKVYASVAAPAPGPIPPSSPLFDPAAEPIVDYSVADATKALKKAGWTKKDDGWYLPDAKKPVSIEVLSTLEDTNPAVVRRRRVGRRRLARARHRRDARGAPGGRARHRPPVGREVRRGSHGRRDRARPGPLPAARVEPDADRRLEHRRGAGPGARYAAQGGPRAGRAGRSVPGVFGPAEAAGEGSLPLAAGVPGRIGGHARHRPGTRRAPGRRSIGPILGRANMAPRRPVIRSFRVHAEVAE